MTSRTSPPAAPPASRARRRRARARRRRRRPRRPRRRRRVGGGARRGAVGEALEAEREPARARRADALAHDVHARELALEARRELERVHAARALHRVGHGPRDHRDGAEQMAAREGHVRQQGAEPSERNRHALTTVVEGLRQKMSEADGRVEPSGAATKSASVRFDEAVAAADAEPKQRRRRRRKARGGRPSKPLPEYFLADHPRREWFFHLSEIQLRLPADALLGQLEGGHVAKERRRGGVTYNKRARRPVPPDASPPSSKAPAQARSTRPPGVEAMLAHAMAAPPPESESGDVFTESSADEDESQGVSALSLRLSDPQRSSEPESRIDPIACPIEGAEAPYDCRRERAAHAAMRQLGCASPPRPHPTARDARSAAERRLADKVQAEWTGFKAQAALVHTPRLGPPSGLGSPTSVNAAPLAASCPNRRSDA